MTTQTADFAAVDALSYYEIGGRAGITGSYAPGTPGTLFMSRVVEAVRALVEIDGRDAFYDFDIVTDAAHDAIPVGERDRWAVFTDIMGWTYTTDNEPYADAHECCEAVLQHCGVAIASFVLNTACGEA